MKLIAALLVSVSLTLGLVASLTVYTPRLADIDPDDELTLNAPAGIAPDDDEQDEASPPEGEPPSDSEAGLEGEQQAEADDEAGADRADSRPLVFSPQPRVNPAAEEDPVILTAELIEQLQADGETRVRVKEFAWGRWTGRYLFVLSCVGLLAGSIMLRISAKPKPSVGPGTSIETGEPEHSPRDLLRIAQDRLRTLQGELASMPEDEKLRTIIRTLNEIQAEQFEPFVASRPKLVQQHGITGYAQIMDQFASAERRLNRAWSAAADEVAEESLLCLYEGTEQLSAAMGVIDRR